MKRVVVCMGLILSMVSVSFAGVNVGNTQVGGYFDTEWVSSKDENTFKAHRFILNVDSQVHERIFVKSEIEFEYGGYLKSSDSGTNGELKIEQAYVDYEFIDNLSFRGGIVLMPIGHVNVYHDSDTRDTTNRPIYSRYIVPSTWMDTGFGLSGEFSVSDHEFTYEGYLVNGLGTGISGSSGLRSARPNFKEDNNKSASFVGRIGWSPLTNAQFGTSMYTGKYDDADNNGVTLIAFDALVKRGPFEGVFEYGTVSVDQTSSEPEKMNGFYVEGRYHFMPKVIGAFLNNQGFAKPTFTLVARYGQVDLDTSVTNAYDITTYTVGANFRPTESTVFKLEYEVNEEDANSVDNNVVYGSVAVGF